MVISVLAASCFTVKSGAGSYINLTSQDRIDSLGPCCTVKIDHTVHNSVVCDRRTVHAKFFDTGYIFFYFIGTIQQTVFCMDVKMCKLQLCISPVLLL